MLAAGERSGRTVQVLNSLAGYYDAQDRLQARLKSAVLYPLVLLLLMAAILAVLLARVMPVFTGVYASLSGSLTASSYRYIAAGYVFGGAALAVTALLASGARRLRAARAHPGRARNACPPGRAPAVHSPLGRAETLCAISCGCCSCTLPAAWMRTPHDGRRRACHPPGPAGKGPRPACADVRAPGGPGHGVV